MPWSPVGTQHVQPWRRVGLGRRRAIHPWKDAGWALRGGVKAQGTGEGRDSGMDQSVGSQPNKTHKRLKMNAFLRSTRQNNVRIFEYVAFYRATNGETDIKHKMGKTLSSMSLLKIVGEKLPPWQSLNLPSLEFRRTSRDMIIETYKIIHGLYDLSCTSSLFILNLSSGTRGHL